MSYILDALKKLEHEKTRKARRDGVASISGTLFEGERPVPSGPAGWKIAFAVLIAVLVTFAATWLFLRSGKEPVSPSARQAAPVSPVHTAPPAALESASVPSPVPAAPAVPGPAAPLEAPPAPAQPPAAIQPAPPVASSASKKAGTRAAKTAKAAKAAKAAAAKKAKLEQSRRTKEAKARPLPPEQVMPAPADIKLSGIAWQEERRARRAVVNGFLMQEGGVVSGARISDIYQDRVRFTQSGKTFEIPFISSGTMPAAK